ncbi:MAG: carbamoyltransferase HypF [Spirochaetales bacterium]|nr:carbamoyltransferase HypF [Spirochaetales bacterium]
MNDKKTVKVLIKGIVQGVGFRPFVFNLAGKMGIGGYIQNNPHGVEIIACGSGDNVDEFIRAIETDRPLQAVIDTIEVSARKNSRHFSGFTIRESRYSQTKFARISPDLTVCEACIRELLDPGNRRYAYPYINCTQCGPRYTITADIPYDRARTTMAPFTMCPECASEYRDPSNRRFHAQPNACHACGPHLALTDNCGHVLLSPSRGKDYEIFFSHLASLLEEGRIIAIKGIGGYHLACDAGNEAAVTELRKRKFRQDKPFAVMVSDLEQTAAYAVLSPEEGMRMSKQDRPILLLERKSGTRLARQIAPASRLIGIMLPYTPIHHLLFRYFSAPLVMTSANISEEPIAHTNEDAFLRLSDIADYFVTGNRDILIRCDDSVIRLWRGNDYPFRRSRGAVPTPLRINGYFNPHVLAVGAEQKNTICFGKENQAIISHHIGDLIETRTYASFLQAIGHLKAMFDCTPGIVAHDLHPSYISTAFVRNPPLEFAYLTGIPRIAVQHHHAHIASCMADNEITGNVIGIALDGTGFGADETIWGGEVLVADEKAYERVASFEAIPLPGGEAAIKRPWRMALSYLYAVFGDECLGHLPSSWKTIPEQEIGIALWQIKEGVNSLPTSSCGRLFDGIAALTGVRLLARYEGQGAVELEQRIGNGDTPAYPFPIVEKNGFFILSWGECITRVAEDIAHKKPVSGIAAAFHNGLVELLYGICTIVSEKTGLRRVALSGGCFMNMYLLQKTLDVLEAGGFRVYNHSRVPCNDGGISLGQAVIANNITRE